MIVTFAIILSKISISPYHLDPVRIYLHCLLATEFHRSIQIFTQFVTVVRRFDQHVQISNGLVIRDNARLFN